MTPSDDTEATAVTATDVTFRLGTKPEISAWLEDMKRHGAFAGYRVSMAQPGRVRIDIRYNPRDPKVRCHSLLAILYTRFNEHGLQHVDYDIVGGVGPIWLRRKK